MVATTWGFLPWYLSYIYIRMYHSIIYLRSNFWGFKVRSNLSEMDTLPMPAFPALERQVDEFRTYVRPTCHPVLTDFCKELTGIQQEQARHRHGRLLMMPLRYSMLFLKKQCQIVRTAGKTSGTCWIKFDIQWHDSHDIGEVVSSSGTTLRWQMLPCGQMRELWQRWLMGQYPWYTWVEDLEPSAILVLIKGTFQVYIQKRPKAGAGSDA